MTYYLLKLNGQYVTEMYYSLEPDTSSNIMNAKFYDIKEAQYWVEVSKNNDYFIDKKLEFEIETYYKED